MKSNNRFVSQRFNIKKIEESILGIEQIFFTIDQAKLKYLQRKEFLVLVLANLIRLLRFIRILASKCIIH